MMMCLAADEDSIDCREGMVDHRHNNTVDFPTIGGITRKLVILSVNMVLTTHRYPE